MEIIAITVPIFIFVAAGYILKQKGIIGQETKNFLSKLVYYFAFPAMTFRSIVSFDFASTFRLKLVAHNLLVTFTIFCIMFAVAFLIKNPFKRGAFHMSCFRSNQGYMGMPIVKGFYGDEALSRAAVVNGFDSSAVIILSVAALEVFRSLVAKRNNASGRTKTALQVVGEKFLSFITNPFIISSGLGLILAYFRVPVLNFKVLDELLKMGSGMALPLALFSIGCSVEVKHLKNNLGLVLGASAAKLLLMPLVAFILGYYVFRLSGTDLGMSVILLATPSSVSSYIMACEMDTDGELSATAIGFTTFLSVLTISVIQYTLKTFFI